jgi:HD-GYP domain-containing protein (c-di-GMP phosphodiesterase class II)
MSYPDEIGTVVLQHHERWDGEGYPYRIAGDKIDIGARIVSIADAFEAMVSPKPYRNSILPYQAMKNLLADNSHRFEPSILKIFTLTIGVYPIGSIVKLNNGTTARVTDVRTYAPLRPKLQTLVD